MIRVYLECGAKWTFACAFDWPGWCRRARSDEEAIEALLAYAPRYASVAAEPSLAADDDVKLIGRVKGNATTDFGAPAVPGEWEVERLEGAELGGGRDRDGVVRHVMEGERGYAPKADVRVPPRTAWDRQRTLITEALQAGAAGAESESKWPARYVLRRMAWHVIDHAWEIEDRSD